MSSDFSRQRFKPSKNFSSVLMQQGRVQLDADWNELLEMCKASRARAWWQLHSAEAVGEPVHRYIRLDQVDLAMTPGPAFGPRGEGYVRLALVENEHRIKQAMKIEMDRSHVLRQVLHCCRKGGTVSIPGVYAGFIDKIPFGTAFGKGLTLKMGQTHVHNYTQQLLDRIQRGDIDPTAIITHRVSLDDPPDMYRLFRDKQDECIKVVMKP